MPATVRDVGSFCAFRCRAVTAPLPARRGQRGRDSDSPNSPTSGTADGKVPLVTPDTSGKSQVLPPPATTANDLEKAGFAGAL